MSTTCPKCFSTLFRSYGKTSRGYQRYICNNCNYQFSVNNSYKREQIINDLLSSHSTIDEIAEQLDISKRTVQRYIKKIKTEPKLLFC